MAQAPQYPDQRRQLMQLLYLKMLQDQMSQTGTPKSQQPTSLDQLLNYAKKAKSTYDDGKNLYNLGSSVVDSFSAPTYSAATQQAWNQSANAASQQAWNAGADAATAQAGEQVGTQVGSEAGTTMADVAPWVAAAFSAYNSGKSLLDKNMSDEDKAYEASMAAPRAAAAFYTLGLSNIGEGFARKQWGGTMKKLDKFNKTNPMSPVFVPMLASRLWTSDKWRTEGDRLRELEKEGIVIPEQFKAAMYQQRGRKKKDLINPYLPKDFIGNTPQYGWTNNKFANSRSESDLRPEDIWGYSAFFKKYGNDWMNRFSEQDRRAIAQKALDRKAVNEHHGTIDVNWSPELDAEANALIGKKVTPQGQPATRPPAPLTASTPAAQIPVASNQQRKGILNKILPR